jgi:hypothetical protein
MPTFMGSEESNWLRAKSSNKRKSRRPGTGGGFERESKCDQRFENWNRLRAPG